MATAGQGEGRSSPARAGPSVDFGRSGLLLLAALGVFWGATFPVVRVGVEAGASPFLLVGIDFLLATVVMATVAAASREPRPTVRSLGGSALLGVLLIGGINLLLFWGIQFTTGGVAAIVFATAPLLSLLAVYLLGRREPLSRRAAIALALGLVGVITLGVASGGGQVVTNPWGLVALAGGAASQGTGAALVSRYRPSGETRWGQAMQFAGGSAVGFLVLPLVGGSLRIPWTLPVIGSTLYVALLTGVLGYTIYFVLIRRVGATRANLVTYLNPLVALAVGVAAVGELVSLTEILGLVLVLGALALLQIRPSPRSDPSPDRN